ncbi:hypothetical protein EYF80_043657 [Liparis tanakae]|uniref:Uncharacterized protein n=1 Tax=Liparis tanakae TaxID=230148 RepID=A0A4Z2G0V6_9TELE|nr:hypothetical protein EYF80_043657 [Liparis tanakae]
MLAGLSKIWNRYQPAARAWSQTKSCRPDCCSGSVLKAELKAVLRCGSRRTEWPPGTHSGGSAASPERQHGTPWSDTRGSALKENISTREGAETRRTGEVSEPSRVSWSCGVRRASDEQRARVPARRVYRRAVLRLSPSTGAQPCFLSPTCFYLDAEKKKKKKKKKKQVPKREEVR